MELRRRHHHFMLHEDLWLRVLRKSVVAVPMEVAARARSRRVGGQCAFDRMRQPQSIFIMKTKV